MASPFANDSPVRILRELRIRPGKALGQHFLHDPGVVRRIVNFAEIEGPEPVLEIGSGLGILTAELARRQERVVAVEKDRFLAEWLSKAAPANVTIIRGDGLEIDPPALCGERYSVVANLPYNVGNAILRNILESNPAPRATTIMVQREVAQRIIARPPGMSVLSVAVQFFGAPAMGFRVGRGAFMPPPNVDSAVIRVVSRTPPLPRHDWKAFFFIVRTGFQQRRKQLINPLSSGLQLGKDAIREMLRLAHIDPTLRPERLDVDDWVRIYNAAHQFIS